MRAVTSQRDEYGCFMREAGVAAPFTMNYLRNNGGVRKFAPPDGFGQKAEPWGRYMSEDARPNNPLPGPNWERGTVTFNNPLRIDHADGAWKQALSNQYGGAAGKALSRRLLKDGYDGVITSDKYGTNEVVDVRPKGKRGHTRTSALSDEDRVSVAEQVMERAGHAGKTFHIPTATRIEAQPLGMDPRDLQRQHSKEAEDFVHQAIGQRLRVDPEHWDLREPGSGQAMTDGYNVIGIKGNDTNAMTLLHEAAHVATHTQHGRGGHGPEFQRAAHDLYAKHISPEAAQTFADIVKG